MEKDKKEERRIEKEARMKEQEEEKKLEEKRKKMLFITIFCVQFRAKNSVIILAKLISYSPQKYCH